MKNLKAALSALGRFAASALLWVFLFTLAGLALVVFGSYLLFGNGVACLVAGFVCLGVASLIVRGLKNA